MSTLKQICGDGFCDDAATLQSAAVQGVKPSAICAPADETQAAEVVRHAIAQKIQLVPYGSGTQQGSSRAPQANFVALSTRRINQLVEHEPGDMVATAQAGMELGAFQEKLGERGQWLPISGNPKSTLGGLLATDYSDALAYGYGTLRDQVLGMRTVNGDGVARKCGGKVVKNVTGFPLEKLYIGSFGTLGLITEVTFKLRPFPVARDNWSTNIVAASAQNLTAGFALLAKIDALNLPLERLNLVWRGALILLADASGTKSELDRIDRELNACTEFGRVNKSIEQHNANSAGYPSNATPPAATLRFWCLKSQLQKVCEAVIAVGGNNYFSLSPDGGRMELGNLPADTAAKIGDALTKLGANFRFENMQGVQIAEPFGAPRGDWELMKRIRASLDPHSLFNSGRFVV